MTFQRDSSHFIETQITSTRFNNNPNYSFNLNILQNEKVSFLPHHDRRSGQRLHDDNILHG